MINKDRSIALYKSIGEANQERVFKYWHASSIAMCPRAHYFKRLGIPELSKPTGAKILRWSAGHHLETSIRDHIENVYGEITSNKRITSEKLDLTGEFDNQVVADGMLVEIKSVSDYAFIERNGETSLKKKTGKLNQWNRPEYVANDKPYLGHELQNHAYVILLAGEGVEVKQIDYVYISLSGRIVVYSTEVQQDLIDNVNARLKALNASWKTKVPPKCICDPKHPLWDSTMQWCPYKTDKECCSLELIK